jgi:hypothetical protein
VGAKSGPGAFAGTLPYEAPELQVDPPGKVDHKIDGTVVLQPFYYLFTFIIVLFLL